MPKCWQEAGVTAIVGAATDPPDFGHLGVIHP